MAVLLDAYAHGLIFCIGILGNLVSFIVYSRKRFKVTIFNGYFRLYVIADSIVIFQAFQIAYAYIIRLWIEDYSPLLFSLIEYTYYFAGPISGHILVIFAIDRYLSVKYPAKFAWRNKKKIQYAICATIIFFNMGCYSDIAVVTYWTHANLTNPNASFGCVTIPDSAFNVFDSINSSIGPFISMLLFTTLTIKAIFDSRKRSHSVASARDIKFAIVSTTPYSLY